MPQKDGVTLCKELREQGYSGAILLLTAKDTLEERIEGLDAGADDYLVKPFEHDPRLDPRSHLGGRHGDCKQFG